MKGFILAVSLVACFYSEALADGGSRSGDSRGGGSSSSEEGVGPTGSGCSCGSTARSNPCRYNNGSTILGCQRSNKYVQCTDTTCLPQICPPGQVWNSTQNTCAACQPGYHVAANNQSCVCDQTTTPTGRFTCGPCPKAAIENPDNCYCLAPLTLNKGANACQACPDNSTLRGDDCKCSATLFWNEAAWACQPCPGTWVSVGSGRRIQQECQCPSPQVFDQKSVSCITCPVGTSPDSDGDSCDCPIRGQYYDTTAKQCQCPPNTQLNTAGTGCQWVPPTTAAPAGRR